MEDIIMTEKNLIPLLRFPKFVRDAEWICTTLRAEMDYENGVAHENDIDSLGKFIVVNSKFISTEGQIEKRSNNAHCLAEENDILMVLSDLPNGKAIAKCFYVDASNKYTVNQRICKLRSKGANSKLLYYLLNRNPYFLSFDDGVKQTNLKKDEVLSCPLIIPKSIEEQQKIAECLSSIDSYISSINEKVEQLKAHKKSLLQKLFPQRGQTVPDYRFSEFKELGMWTEKTLGDIGDVCMCKRIMKNETNINYSIPFYKIGTFGQKADSYITEERFNEYKAKYSYPQKGDILFSAAGTIGRYVEFDGEPAYFQDSNIVWIANNETLVCNKFLKYLYSKVQWNIYDGGVVKRLYNDSIKKTSIHIPSMPEQRKIAGCLSSIDEAITLYSEKVSLIEQHKKGLMQQLFPTPK